MAKCLGCGKHLPTIFDSYCWRCEKDILRRTAKLKQQSMEKPKLKIKEKE